MKAIFGLSTQAAVLLELEQANRTLVNSSNMIVRTKSIETGLNAPYGCNGCNCMVPTSQLQLCSQAVF